MKNIKIKYYNIPIFIPEESCPFTCIYCDQKKISGASRTPTPKETETIIENHLKTLPNNDTTHVIGLAFFGGNFTGIDLKLQQQYLDIANKYLHSKQISSIRLSTRPDYIDEQKLAFLKHNNVTAIELGVQSTDDEVLKLSKRGYLSSQVFTAAKLIKKYNFILGLQMMIGLPGDNKQKAIKTAQDIVNMEADETRIYPLLIIKDTDIHKMYIRKEYTPLELSETIDTCADLVKIFMESDIKILRLGLHPSEDLSTEKDLIAGPYSPALKQIVLSQIWMNNLESIMDIKNKNKTLELEIAAHEASYAAGYKGINKEKLMTVFKKVKFIKNTNMDDFQYRARIN